MPSGAIIYEENFHERMALNNIATLNSEKFRRESFYNLSLIRKIYKNFPLENNPLCGSPINGHKGNHGH